MTPCTTTRPVYTTTTTPPWTPPPFSNGCLRVFYTCDCEPPPSRWVLNFRDCVTNGNCSGALICNPLIYYHEYPDFCVVSDPVPPGPDPGDAPCEPFCCVTYPPWTTAPPPFTPPPFTPPPQTNECQADWTAVCYDGTWHGPTWTSVCVAAGACQPSPWAAAGNCTQQARTCIADPACSLGGPCATAPNQPVPNVPGDVPPCCLPPPLMGQCQFTYTAVCINGVWTDGGGVANGCVVGCTPSPGGTWVGSGCTRTYVYCGESCVAPT